MKKNILPFWTLTLLAVFLLSFFWEFFLEEHVSNLLPTDHASENDKDKWRFVRTAVIFSGLALIFPSLWVWREKSKRRALGNALRETELRHKHLFMSIPDPILILDVESHRFEDVNDAALKEYGYTRKEFLQLSPDDLSAGPEEPEDAFQPNPARSMGKVPVQYHRRKGGAVFPAELTAGTFTVKNKDKVFAVVRNISERKDAENKIRESEERYRTVYNQLRYIASGTAPATSGRHFFQSLVSHLALALNVKYAFICVYKGDDNALFRTLALCENGEILNNIEYEATDTPFEMVAANQIALYPKNLKAHFPKRLFLLGKDIESYIGIPLPDDRGQTSGLLGIMDNKPIRDIENAKSILSVFASRAAAELQRMWAEEKRSENAEKLRDSNRELQDFVAIASHDLKEPLRKIINFGDRLQTVVPESDAAGRDYLMRMQSAAARMQTFLEDLLLYTEVGSKESHFKQVDLNEVIREVLHDMQTEIERRSARVRVVHLPVLEADPFQMRQLFQHLIANALKFHRENVPPAVRLDSRFRKEGLWEISVEDNGIGIDETHVERIFRPFERLHSQSDYEGTGIGLTLCHKIVSRHNGRIEVKSQPEAGTVFQILLPEKQNLEA